MDHENRTVCPSKPQNKKEQPDHSDSKMPALISGIEKNI